MRGKPFDSSKAKKLPGVIVICVSLDSVSVKTSITGGLELQNIGLGDWLDVVLTHNESSHIQSKFKCVSINQGNPQLRQIAEKAHFPHQHKNRQDDLNHFSNLDRVFWELFRRFGRYWQEITSHRGCMIFVS